jgi:hypothetical protein
MRITGGTLTTAIFSLLGLIIGASLQYVFTRHLESQRHHRELRTQAYGDYLRSVSELAHLNDPLGSQERDAIAAGTDAKARICLYGSKEVIRAFAQFETLGASVKSVPQRQAFVGMVSAMRDDSGSPSNPKVEDMETILIGKSDRESIGR